MFIFKNIFLTLLVSLIFFLAPNLANGYSTITHSALTSLTIDLYNSFNVGNEITEEEKEWIIQGSINEDYIPRFFNHFYDPVRDISWNYENLGQRGQEISEILAKSFFYNNEPIKSIDWVNDSLNQNRLKNYGGNRTWNKGLDYLVDNNKEEALKTLGHVLHLLQDMAVPDHTRNDPHPPLGGTGKLLIEEEGSPYEHFTKRYNVETVQYLKIVEELIENNLVPPRFKSIEDYLEAMAVYSNRYFLSRDTVDDNNYRYPEIKRDDGYFGYGLDENGEEFPLVEVREKEISKFVFGDSYVITPVSYDVLDSYFERLGPKAVLYGVGVVELFFNSEDEWKIIKEINPYNDSELSLVDRISYDFSFAGEIQKITNRTKNLLGSIGGLISDTFTSENDLELTQVIDLTEENSNSEEIVNNLVSESVSEIQAQTEIVNNCSFSSNSNLKKGDILINEVAWMGTENSPSDEWMELKNISDQSINVDGYKVIGERNQINIVLPNISLESGEFLLLERKEGSVPHIDSDLIYTGVLRNSDEGIRVFDPGCNLIDEVFANPDWPAGDNSSKKTMERQANLSWQTSFFEGGTPKEDSSKGDVNINPEVFVDKTSLVRGEVLDEGGSGFSPNSRVELHFILPNGRDVVDYITTDDNGDFLKVYTMPYDALLGDYSYYAIDLSTGESSSSVNYKVTVEVIKEEVLKDTLNNEEEDEEVVEEKKEVIKEEEEEVVVACDFNSFNFPDRSPIIINEVAWMGTQNSPSDEWIELKNVSNKTIDISGYQILDFNGRINIKFPNNITVRSNNYLLLERTDDSSVPGVAADLIYTGALSNSNEGLRLFNRGCRLIDEVFADSDWLAGDNSSKRTMERQADLSWRTSILVGGTPRALNTQGLEETEEIEETEETEEEEDDSQSNNQQEEEEENEEANEEESNNNNNEEEVLSSGSDTNVVISEVMPGMGTGSSDEEFIELYNTTNEPINLSGWSLGRKVGSDDSIKILVDSFSDSLIYPNGFFLVGSIEYQDSKSTSTITLNQLFSSNERIAYSNNSIVLINDLEEIVDEMSYDSISRESSLERYTYKEGNCYLPINSFEFMGNSCPESVFLEREIPHPQNKESMIEPRTPPESSGEFTIDYDGDIKVSFDWSPYIDSEGNSSNMTYEIIEHSSSTDELIFKGTDVGFDYNIDKVGNDYSFSFRALDRDGMPSTVSSSTIETFSFFDSVKFYKDPSSPDTGKYFIDTSYSDYPFVPDIYKGGDSTWKAVLFYLSKDSSEDSPEIITNWNFSDIDAGLRFKYRKCSGVTSVDYLLFPDTPSNCSSIGGGNNPKGISYSHYGLEEVNSIQLELEITTDDFILSEEDYVTPVFYSFNSSGGGSSSLKRVAYDENKYYFQENTEELSSPTINDFDLLFNQGDSTLTLTWSPAIDEDTLNELITYEVNFSPSLVLDGGLWESIGPVNEIVRAVSSGDEFTIGLRAKDNTGNLSNVIIKSWKYPSLIDFKVTQISENNWSDNWGKVSNSISNPSAASFQSFTPEENFSFDSVVLKLKHENGADTADIKLSVFESIGDHTPDFVALPIGKAILGNVINPDSNNEVVFEFENPVQVSSGNTYWLMLDVSRSGSDGRQGLFRNDWQNAITTGGSAYSNGKAGEGKGMGYNDDEFCALECSFDGNYSAGESDWYFKLGLRN